ncbi:3-dehydroquinate synthase [Listeria kieliensis]|uniref:3-dehydroquinate synthase n=1 Tax=Listeria kieliensis TaxID=1621700 RepID=A0A3D8TU35_9LIST|nr:3-dehydroquinate synthase [Listeria kieliensis]RDX02395.1 3-dehydroquinate synthase [Listeria kieliensis]
MREIKIETASQTYPVYIGEALFESLKSSFARELKRYSKLLVVTDQHVSNLHREKMEQFLSEFQNVSWFVTPNGEAAKTFSVYEAGITKAIEAGLDRKSALLAFGGGVIGDLGGMIAATYMRGIPFYQFPTTVLAHDSAVGGKVAINHPLGKNLVGNFYQPEAVVYDTSLLATLSTREMRSGFAELIKHALISDSSFLKSLEGDFASEADLYGKSLPLFLEKGIAVKADIVKQDETEQGVRAFLNFGHTFGHALEAFGGFERFLHGEAIIYGMLYALRLSKKLTGLDFEMAPFEDWLVSLGYETKLPQDVPFEAIYENMLHDKKTTFGEITFVLLREVGSLTLQTISQEVLEETFTQFKEGGDA